MALLVDRLAGSHRLAPIITLGVAGYCLPTALLTVVHSPELAFALQVVRGGSTLVVDVLAVAALQRAVPDEQLARVFGVFFAFVLGAISLGALVTPPDRRRARPRCALLTMAVAPIRARPARLSLARGHRPRDLRARRGAGSAGCVPGAARLLRHGLAARPRAAGRPGHRGLVPAGTAVVREGDPADALYVLVDGEVEVTARGEATTGSTRSGRCRRRPTSARSACSSEFHARPRSRP